MLIVTIPRTALPALASDGYQCRIDDEPVLLRLDGDRLCYRDLDGTEHRCKILYADDQGDRVMFMAASHGDENEPHSIIAVGEDGKPVDLLKKEEP